jgi:hypothetical protein
MARDVAEGGNTCAQEIERKREGEIECDFAARHNQRVMELRDLTAFLHTSSLMHSLTWPLATWHCGEY